MNNAKKRALGKTKSSQEATAGFEPAIRELQSHALPLGYVATDNDLLANRYPSIFSEGKRCSEAAVLAGNLRSKL